MSIASLIIALFFVFVYCKNSSRKYLIIFETTVFVSLFLNCGYSFIIGSITVTYSLFCQILAIVLIVLSKKSILIPKRILPSFAFLILSISLSFVILTHSNQLPKIIPWTTRMDDVYFQVAQTEYPSFGYGNYLNIINILIFSVFLLLYRDLLTNEQNVNHIISSLFKVTKVLLVLAGCEFIINNLISPNIVRSIVQFITGISSNGYTIPQMRNGFYAILLGFNEQSYFIVFIAIYLYILTHGINQQFNIKWMLYGCLIMFLSGSSSVLLVIPVAFLAIIKDANTKSKINRNILIISIIICFGLFVLIAFGDIVLPIINSLTLKLSSYFNLSYDSQAVSGTIRNMGNTYAYNAFISSPLFGIGFGTTRAYGILPGCLANSGIIGTFALLNWLKNLTGTKLCRNNIFAFILLLVCCTSILSVGYLYDPSIVVFSLVFNQKKNMLQN